MATWLTHLRIADRILTLTPGLVESHYVMGSIAPDSGLPSLGDGHKFIPSKEITHFQVLGENGRMRVNPALFAAQFLRHEQVERYDEKALSFYLGYYDHLLTDLTWVGWIHSRLTPEESAEFSQGKGLAALWKKDWYDQDFLYLAKNGSFRAYEVYCGLRDFQNIYAPWYGTDDLGKRQKDIVAFYQAVPDGIDREYAYLREEQLAAFIDGTVTLLLESNRRAIRIG